MAQEVQLAIYELLHLLCSGNCAYRNGGLGQSSQSIAFVVAVLHYRRDHVPRVQGFVENIVPEMIDMDFREHFR